MKEQPIIFSTEMVKAILEGRKTMTRRVIKKPNWFGGNPKSSIGSGGVYSTGDLSAEIKYYNENGPNPNTCPYGGVGDLLWVRETWRTNAIGGVSFKADEGDNWIGEWRPSIHMFRKDSRITLEIAEVRVGRVQEITPADCVAEGVSAGGMVLAQTTMLITGTNNLKDAQDVLLKCAYKELWGPLNAKRGYGWETNPFVWCISFKKIDV